MFGQHRKRKVLRARGLDPGRARVIGAAKRKITNGVTGQLTYPHGSEHQDQNENPQSSVTFNTSATTAL
jgi:hypothetical protein